MKQLEVQIMGQSYLLGCPEGGDARLLDAVEKVDTAMCKIRDAGKVKARDRIAVLAALNLAFDVSDRVPAVFPSSFGVLQSAGQGHAAAMPSSPERDEEAAVPRLTLLLERLDSALSSDGRLI